MRQDGETKRKTATCTLSAVHILITGGAGFIGTRLAASLTRSDARVVIFDSLHPQVHQELPALADHVEFHPGDVRDSESWDRYFLRFDKPDVIVHLAAETGTGQSLTEASRHGSTNVVGTTQLTDALVRHHCVPGHVMVASSRAVYGEGEWSTEGGIRFHPPTRTAVRLAAGKWDPDSPDGSPCTPLPHSAAQTWPRPTNIYAATKLAQEHLLESWCTAYGSNLSIFRLQNVYGPGQAIGNAYTGVLTHFATQISAGEQVEVFEDGNILRDFVYIDDVVDAFLRLMFSPPATVRRVDIGGGRPLSLLEVANMMCGLGGAPDPVVSGRFRLGDVRAASADIAAAGQLGWAPATSVHAGLSSLVEWVDGRS